MSRYKYFKAVASLTKAEYLEITALSEKLGMKRGITARLLILEGLKVVKAKGKQKETPSLKR